MRAFDLAAKDILRNMEVLLPPQWLQRRKLA
jgi:hypothetical protein